MAGIASPGSPRVATGSAPTRTAGIGPANPVAMYLPRCWRAAPTVDSADEIVLDPGSVATGVTIRLPARGRIRGHVTDPAGAPVTGGYAQAYWNESGRWVPGP